MDGGSAEPSLAEIHQEMSGQTSECTKEKIFRGSRKLPQAHEKVCDENESRIRKKRHMRKIVIHGRKPFIMPKQKTATQTVPRIRYKFII